MFQNIKRTDSIERLFRQFKILDCAPQGEDALFAGQFGGHGRWFYPNDVIRVIFEKVANVTSTTSKLPKCPFYVPGFKCLQYQFITNVGPPTVAVCNFNRWNEGISEGVFELRIGGLGLLKQKVEPSSSLQFH